MFSTSVLQSFSALTPTVQIQQAFSLRDFNTNYKSNKHWLIFQIFQTTGSCSTCLRQGQARGSVHPDTEQHYQRPSKVSKRNLKFTEMWHLLENVACILAGIMLNTATQYALEDIPIVTQNHSLWNKMVGSPVEKHKSAGILCHK